MRAFVALDFDAALRKALGRMQDRIRPLAAGLRYVEIDAMHLTLKFLGEIEDPRVPEVSAALDSVASRTSAFSFDVCDLGVFADRAGRVRVIWAGIEDAEGALAALQSGIESALEKVGYPPESRPFSPHLTLARSKRPTPQPKLVQFIENEGKSRFGMQDVDAFTLYESQLTREGPIYTPISRHELQSP